MAESAIDSSKTIKTWMSPLQLINDRQSLRIRSGWFPIIGFASPRCDPALVHPFSAFASAAFTPMDSQPANNGVPMNKKGSHLRRRLFRGLGALLTLRYFLTRHVRLHLQRLTHDPVELLGAHAQFATGLGDVPLSVEILEAVRCALKFAQPRRFEQAPRRKATVGLALRGQREEPADAFDERGPVGECVKANLASKCPEASLHPSVLPLAMGRPGWPLVRVLPLA